MAGEVPDVYAKFVADTSAFLAPVLKSVEAVLQLSGALADLDGALDAFRTAAVSSADATVTMADGAKAAADAQAALGDAAKLDADSQDVLFGALDALVGSEVAARDAALALADADKVAADASKLAADAAKVNADEQVVAAGKTKTAAEETGLLSGALGKAGGAVGAFGGVAKKGLEVFGAATAASVYEAAKFNAEIMRLHDAANVPLTDLPHISQKMLELGNQYGFSGTKMAEAMYHAASAGLPVEAAITAVGDAAQLADIHGASLDKTTYALSSVMKAFGIDAGHAGDATAMLNSIVGQGDMRFEQFNASIKNWAPTAASMGISIQSMGAAIAYLTDRGNSAEVAATRLTQGLSMMTSGSKQANSILHSLGLTADTVGVKNKNLADIMQHAGLTTNKLALDLKKPDGIFVALTDLREALRKSGASAEEADAVLAKIFGGGRSDKAIMSLMQNLDGLKQKFDATGAGAKNLGDAAQHAAETPAQQFKNLEATVQNLAIQFGTAMLPALTAVSGALQKMFADPTFVKSMQDLGKYVGEVFKAAAPLVPVLAKLAEQFMKALGPLLPIMAAAIEKIAKSLGDNLGRALAKLAPQLPALTKSMADLLIALMPLIPSLADMLIALAPLVPAFTAFVEVMAKGLHAMLELYLGGMKIFSSLHLLAVIVGFVVKEIARLWQWLYDELIGHSIIPDLVNGILSWFGRGMSGMVSTISKGVGDAVSWFAGLPGKVLGALGDLGGLLYNAGASIIQGLMNGIDSMLGSLWNKVSSIAGTISNLKGPIEKDRALLVPHGQALMQGLQTGIEQGLVQVYGAVSGIAPGVAAGVGGTKQNAAEIKHLTILENRAERHEKQDTHEENLWKKRLEKYHAEWEKHHSKRYSAAMAHAEREIKHYAGLEEQQDKLAAIYKTQIAGLAAMRPGPWESPGGPLAAGLGPTSGIGALAYAQGGTVIHNTTIVQVQGSILSDRDVLKVMQKGLAKASVYNSTNGASVPSGRTG